MLNKLKKLLSLLLIFSTYVSGLPLPYQESQQNKCSYASKRRPVPSELDVGILKVSNDRTHLEGIWKVDQAYIDTGEFTTSAPVHEVEQQSESSGFSISFSPLALATAAISMVMFPTAPMTAATVSLLPTVSFQESESSVQQKVHTPMVMDANDLYIRCDNAVFSGSTIRAKMVDMIVTGNLTVETLLDDFRSESSSTEFSASLSAIFGAVLCIETTPKGSSPKGNLPKNLLDNPTLSAIPHFRMCDEVKIEERINHVAQLVGTERFYLKVGSLLHSKGAEIGLVPDGIANKSEAEAIEAGRILEEKVQESSYHSVSVINPSISELMAAATQVTELQALKAKIAEAEVLKGKKILEADKVVREVEQAAQILEEADVRVEMARKKMTSEIRETISKKSAVVAVKVAEVDDEHLSAMVERYADNMDEINASARRFAEEKAEIYAEVERELASRSWLQESVHALNDFVESCREVTSEEGLKFRENPGKYTVDVASGAIYLAADFVTPGGIDAPVEFIQGEKSFTEAVEAQTKSVAIEMAVGVVAGKTARIGGKALSKISSKVAQRTISKTEAKVSKILQERKVGRTGKYDDLTAGKPFHDGLEAHHMPAKSFMKKHGVHENEGLSIILTEEQHAITRTYKGKARKIEPDATVRSELAKDIMDVKKILKRDGLYTPDVKASLKNGIEDFKTQFPQLFEKVTKK